MGPERWTPRLAHQYVQPRRFERRFGSLRLLHDGLIQRIGHARARPTVAGLVSARPDIRAVAQPGHALTTKEPNDKESHRRDVRRPSLASKSPDPWKWVSLQTVDQCHKIWRRVEYKVANSVR